MQSPQPLSVRPSILVADDDSEMRALLAETLRADGFEIFEAASGRELVQALLDLEAENREPVLIISDIRMPDGTGLDVARMIRDWGWTLPLILVTGFGDEEMKLEATYAGATCLFSKPFDVDDMRTAVLHFTRAPDPPSGRPLV